MRCIRNYTAEIILVIVSAAVFSTALQKCPAQETPQELSHRIEFLQTMEGLVSGEIKRRQTPLVFDRQTPAPPSYALQSEAQIKSQWMTAAVAQAAESYKKADATADPSVKRVWLKDAALKADTAHNLVRYYLGDDVDLRRPSEEGRRRIEEAGQRGVELAASTKETVDSWIQGRKPDPEFAGALQSKQAELEATIARQLYSLEKANAAGFVGEARFWLSDSELQKEKVRRLSVEIMSGMTKSPEDAKILPDLVKALSTDNPAEREKALQVVEAMVEQGWGPKIMPKLIEELRKQPPKEDATTPSDAAGAFSQMDRQEEARAAQTPLDVAYQQSLDENQAEFDQTGGISGAGGISLHAPARFLPPFDGKKASRAYVESNRLVLVYDGQPVRFPPLDPEFLALALRNVLGEEGAVEGTLLDESDNGIVMQTPPDQFGQVVWKKEFLPAAWRSAKSGEPVRLTLGPAFGLSAASGASLDRGTYYGTITNTRLGQVLFDADAVLASLYFGIDLQTGRPADLSAVKRFATGLERGKRAQSQKRDDANQSRQPSEDRGPWYGHTWFVWVPDDFSLKLNQETGEFEFATARMKMAVWSMNEDGLDPTAVDLGREATARFDELAEWRPVLRDLVDVAKAVTVVRWLKQAGIPVDLEWAHSFKIGEVKTPETVTRYTMYIDFSVDFSKLPESSETKP